MTTLFLISLTCLIVGVVSEFGSLGIALTLALTGHPVNDTLERMLYLGVVSGFILALSGLLSILILFLIATFMVIL